MIRFRGGGSSRLVAAVACAALVFCAGAWGQGFSGAMQVGAGLYHSLGLKSDGTVWAWGHNYYGQLGDGTTADRTSPVQVSGLSGVAAVAGEYCHSLALKGDGSVWAWGYNIYGQLGDNTAATRTVPVQVQGLGGVVAVAAGADFSLALKSDGTVWAWGHNAYGQLGDGTTATRKAPVQVGGLSGVVAIAGGYFHGLAVKSDGSVWAWGYNAFGQLGDGTTANSAVPVRAGGLGGVAEVSAGAYHSMAAKSDGSAWAWGYNAFGQLGDGTTANSAVPVRAGGLGGVAGVSAGAYHSMAWKSDGSAWAWGFNSEGEVGDGTFAGRPSPVQVQVGGIAVGVAAGGYHSLVLQADGIVCGFGENKNGQLGCGTTALRQSPVQASGLSGVVRVAASQSGGHISAVKGDGSVWAWGYNYYGQLGDGTATERPTPVQVSGLSGVAGTAGGAHHSLAVKSDGSVWAWGYNLYGQLGDGTIAARRIPVRVNGLGGVVEVAGGAYHSLALKGDGSVWAWGLNNIGQLGDGTTTTRMAPVRVSGLGGVVAVAAGSYFSLALKNDGSVWAWGLNNSGQLGDGTAANRSVPVQVNGLGGVAGIAAGCYHSLALKGDGSVWAWGGNSCGALGDGTTVNRPTPVRAGGPGGLAGVAAGSYHSIAIQSDGSAWAWGLNTSCQLGDGTEVNRLSPEQIGGIQGAVGGAAGNLATFVLKEDGTLSCWGSAMNGELGIGVRNAFPLATPIKSFNLGGPATLAVSISSPASGTSSALGQPLAFSVSGAGQIAGVDFYNESILVGSSAAAPFHWNWTPPTWGTFHVTAVARSGGGLISAPSAAVSLAVPYDGDGHGLPDWWQRLYFGQTGIGPAGDPDHDGYTNLQEYQGGSGPANYFSQPDGRGGTATITPAVTIAGGNNQAGLPGEYLGQPLSVEARNSANNDLLPNAPVVFTVAGGGGGLASQAGNGTPGPTLSATTGADGRARAYFRQGSAAASANTVAARAGQSAPATFTARTTMANGLWGEWKFDEGGGTTAADSTGLTASGTLTNQPQWSQGFDGRGGMSFGGFQSEGGTNAYVTMGNPADRSLDFGSESFSIALWVKYTDGTFPPGQNGRRIISKGHHGFNPGYTIVLAGDGRIWTGIGATQGGASQALFFHTVPEYNDGKWHHVAAVFDRQNSTARIYVDGAAQELAKETTTGGGIDPQDPTVINYPTLANLSATRTDMPLTVSSHMGVYDFFKGEVDEVRFYRKAITGQEEQALYNSDIDGNGLPDRWEWEHFGQTGIDPAADPDGDGLTNLQEYQQGSDPNDYYNGLAPTLTITSGNNQTGSPGNFVSAPLVVRAAGSAGSPLAKAPLAFSVTQGGGTLQATAGGTNASALTVRTNASGYAIVYFQLPGTTGASQITCAPATGGGATGVVFTETSSAGGGGSPNPTLPPSNQPDNPPTPPVVSYAAIDVGGGVAIPESDQAMIALGDDNNGAFAFYDLWSPGASMDVYTWNNGTTAFCQTVPGTTLITYESGYTEDASLGGPVPLITPSGKVYGTYTDETIVVNNPFSCVGGNVTLFPELWFTYPTSCNENGFGGVLGQSGCDYRTIDGVGIQQGWFSYICQNGNFTYFVASNGFPLYSPDNWAEPVDPPSNMQLTDWGPRFFPNDMNSQGCAIGGGWWSNENNSTRFWNGSNFTDLPAPGHGLNDQNCTLCYSSDTNGKIQGEILLWQPDGQVSIASLLPADYRSQISNVRTGLLSNADANGTIHILMDATFTDPVDGSTTPKTYVLSVPYTAPSAANSTLQEVKLPDGGGVWCMNANGVMATIGYTVSDNYANQHPLLLVPVDLAVDANRDGVIDNKDRGKVTEQKPWRWWINDDNDGTGDGSENVGGAADSADAEIKSKRDLEDLTRLWFYFGGMQASIADGTFKIGLKWKSVTGSPSIKIYQAVETDGGVAYLTSDATAGSQIGGTYKTAKATVSGSTSVMLPTDVFTNFSEQNPTAHLLFEGVSEGKGQLVVTIHKSDGTEIGEGPGVWLDLKQIKDMYERGFSNPINMIAPFDRAANFDIETVSVSTTGASFQKPSDETSQCILYVHGWNTDVAGYDANSATMFKRLWHRGFKGRFAALRWDTMMGGAFEFESFHISEWRGYNFGKSLQDYATNLRSRLSGYSINVIAHSLGSALLTSALDRGVSIDNCIYTQGALSASMFDPNAPLRGGNFTTPDLATDGGYRGWLAPSAVNIVSFFNSGDTVLFGWQAYQNGKPHDATGPGQYRYTASTGRRWIEYSSGSLPTRDVFDNHESMAFVAISRTAAVGAEGATAGAVNVGYNLGSGGLGYGGEHSPQFERRIQQNLQPYYNQILLRFDITPNP
ncbi:MAG: LamG-like jellyroll fold domain-containing protein [Terrimicrobiaceae bacterium]